MGYYIKQRDGDFVIKAKNMPKACETLQKLRDDKMQWPPYSISEFAKNMRWWGYYTDFNKGGDCVDIFKEHGKFVSDDEMFSSIAPYVEHGSFLEFEGEDGYLWRYVFTQDEMHEVPAKIVWEDDIL